MDYILTALSILALLTSAVTLSLVYKLSRARDNEDPFQELRRELTGELRGSRQETVQTVAQNVQTLSTALTGGQAALQKAVNDGLNGLDFRLQAALTQQEFKLEAIRQTVESRLAAIQQDSNQKLEQMRATVDEKLQKTLAERIGQSFQMVSERLEAVYKGLGEMQSLAAGVGDLKRVLSNVKTRGILGELQLGAILEEILSPEQYEANVATRPGSRDVVEYAVKLPGDGETPVYLPIDAKFPGETYQKLLLAYEGGVKEEVEAAAAALERVIRQEARDIRDKYIDPPHTTDFGILFLPVEGLYAEAVRRGLVETLQRESRINLAGPTTMAALLNALQMGFKTLAIQKRSGQVWELLGAVKTEFARFSEVLQATQNRLEQAQNELHKLVGTRTRAIERKLREVESLEEKRAETLLE